MILQNELKFVVYVKHSLKSVKSVNVLRHYWITSAFFMSLHHSCNGSPRCLNVSLMVLSLYYTLLPKSQPTPGISAQTHVNCDADREDVAPGTGPPSHHVHFCKTETNVINIHGENRPKCIQQTPQTLALSFLII